MSAESTPQTVAPFEIAGTMVQPGENATIHLPVSELFNQLPLSLPVRVIHSRRPGPRMVCVAGIHGDELNGTEIVRRLLRHRALKRLRGTLLAVPVVNIHGFISLSRYLPDRRDLNRMFPGSESGSLASRLAWLLMEEVVRRCTHGIDLHTASNHRFNLPQVRTQPNPEARRLARVFGAPVVVQSDPREGSLREAAHEAGIPMLVYESGEALRFDESAIRLGLRGILSVMREIGMLSGKPHKPRFTPHIAVSSRWVRSEQGGIFLPACRLGTPVEKGALLGRISDPFGDYDTEVVSPINGIVIGMLQMPLINRGDALIHLARAEGDPDEWQDWSDWEQELVPVDPGDDHLGPPTTT